MKIVYPETTGALCAKMDRGLSGQDAVNGMVLVLSNNESVNTYRGGVSSTLMARDYKSASDLVVEPKQRKYIVRRLTPTECARLQGFPDWWCEGLGGSDSAIYKAYGNGLALPCAVDVLRRIAKEYDQTAL
jgi:site-specific DNA-cytosine methylase